MYRTDFWTLWEKARVGCFERTGCILFRVKQITSPGWMHETSARAWCPGKTQRIGWRGRWEGGSGWGIHVTPWLIHASVWQNPLQCCEVISLQLIKINEKKKRVGYIANKQVYKLRFLFNWNRQEAHLMVLLYKYSSQRMCKRLNESLELVSISVSLEAELCMNWW